MTSKEFEDFVDKSPYTKCYTLIVWDSCGTIKLTLLKREQMENTLPRFKEKELFAGMRRAFECMQLSLELSGVVVQLATDDSMNISSCDGRIKTLRKDGFVLFLENEKHF
jgi:hypothetical protein